MSLQVILKLTLHQPFKTMHGHALTHLPQNTLL